MKIKSKTGKIYFGRVITILLVVNVLTCISLTVQSGTRCDADSLGTALDKSMTFAYYPGLKKLEVRIAGLTLKSSVANQEFTARVSQKGRQEIMAQQSFLIKDGDGMCMLDLPVMADGMYELHVSPGDGGAESVRQFRHKNFPWLGNDLGKNNVIYPPFEPIQVEGKEVQVVLRDYTMNGFGLWNSVKSKGKEILAGPIVLHVSTSAGEQSWQFHKGEWVVKKPHLAVYKSEASAPAVKIRTRSTLEYDGCMKVEMELLPGESRETIQKMWMEIPVKDSEAPLFHYTAFESMRRNYAGKTPRGGRITWMSQPYDSNPPKWPDGALPPIWKAEQGSDDGMLWTCRDIRPWKHVITTDFVPYIWLGGAERGLAFFGANDRGYLVDPGGTMQTLERKGDILYLKIDLVNKPSVIREPRQIVFGLQASPTRPMTENWRVKQKITPAMPGPVVCWGGYLCANKYPEGYHWDVVDEIVKVRKTGFIDTDAFRKFGTQRAEPWKIMWGWTEGSPFEKQDWLGRDFWYFVERAKTLHNQSDPEKISSEGIYTPEAIKILANPSWITYTEEHASDISEPEWEVFQDEWRAAWPWNKSRDDLSDHPQPENNFGSGNQAFPESYIDFSLYYQNEWFKRGIGVYFDNTMPYTMYNPLLSDAYFDETGRLQPACSIWEQRDYYKRVWQLMNEVQQKGVPYPLTFAQHITNTRLLPLNTWSTITLDIEWDWFLDTLITRPVKELRVGAAKDKEGRDVTASTWKPRQPFPPDLLLAETTGYQTGTMGSAHFGLLGNPAFASAFPPTYGRSEWGMRKVHELNSRGSDVLEKALWKFGYGSDRTKVINYWSDNPPVTINDPENNKWLLVTRESDKSLFLVLQTWNKPDTKLTVRLDPEKLGFIPGNKAWDVETGFEVPFNNNSLELDLAGPYGTRVIIIGSKN